jgi:energy-coupling factor transporter ATP-binding protein EcfA2
VELNGIFNKAIDRTIEGVIKADDLQSLKTEIEEYVITGEIESRLDEFLTAYTDYQGANGVWISGFFGSGKSHLLKMLALLLENYEIDDKRTGDIFKDKCNDNAVLKGNIDRAVKIPSKSILFNIDQKANVISKTETEALIAVFVKVFDEACGYYGSQPYIAQFERDLAREGLFIEFQEKFLLASDNKVNWIKGRVRAKRYSKLVDSAYNAVTHQEHIGILDKYRADYKLSIEDFANNVKAYIDSKGKKFRLNFFVDEVGQYIADNVKLMTNLQTVAESLNTICQGRAWVIVTAQEEMASILGDMDKLAKAKSQSNDFTKIQGRFKNRMKLTSANVEEVIKKRLLEKKDSAVDLIANIYKSHQHNFRTMFDFVDGSKHYKNFKDCDHFVEIYPFVPYQFTLFQTAITNLSGHNAFEGRHSSVGERSMLGVFQTVARQIGKQELNNLASFDLMFEGIRTSLKTNIQSSITIAEKHLHNDFAVKLLKALFLVKYIKEFKATVRNIVVLMIQSLDMDLEEVRLKVEEALNILENQSYIQRNRDEYEYLTDDEKDIEEDIKNTDIDSNEIVDEFNKLIFDDILKKNKIRYPDNKRDYQYTKKIDDKQYGHEYEMAIHVITPLNDYYSDETTILMHSMNKDELIVMLADDGRIIKDLRLFKQTEKYVKQNNSQTLTSNVQRILVDKTNKNIDRRDNIKQRIESLILTSKLFINGEELPSLSSSGASIIESAFFELIRRTYPYLKMVRKNYRLSQIPDLLTLDNDNSLLEVLNEAQEEIFREIRLAKNSGQKITLKSLINKFTKKPYGWDDAAVICIVVELYKLDKLEARHNSEMLEAKDIYFTFDNSINHDKIVLNPLVEFSKTQIKLLNDFYNDFFEEPAPSSDARTLANEVKQAMKSYCKSLTNNKNPNYPFNNILNDAIELFNEVANKPYDWFLTSLDTYYDKLVDTKLDESDPILNFMSASNSQREIFDSAKNVLINNNSNLDYVESEDIKNIEDILSDESCLKANKINKLKQYVDTLTSTIQNLVEEERNNAITEIKALETKLIEKEEFKELTSDQETKFLNIFSNLISLINNTNFIPVIRDKKTTFKDNEYPQITREISLLKSSRANSASNLNSQLSQEKQEQKLVSSKKLLIDYKKMTIATEDDLEEYLAKLKAEYKKQLANGKIIEVN